MARLSSHQATTRGVSTWKTASEPAAFSPPGQCRSQVVMFHLETVCPPRLIGCEPERRCPLGQVQTPIGVCGANCRLLTALGKALGAVLANGFQHVQPRHRCIRLFVDYL